MQGQLQYFVRILFLSINCFYLIQTVEAQVFIQDDVGMFSPEEIEILGKDLEAYEAFSGHEIAIRVIDSLDLSEKPIRIYAFEMFKQLGIGKKGLDNGILFLWAPKNRKIAIELGYGMEPYISDGQAKYIIDKRLIPNLRSENYLYAFKQALSFTKVLLEDFVNTSEVYRDSLLIDEFQLLSAKEQKRLRDQLEDYRQKSGHLVWVRIIPNKNDMQTSRVLANRLFHKLHDTSQKVYQTLIYVGVKKVERGDVYFNKYVSHNWSKLARKLSAADDYYKDSYQYRKASDVVAYRLELALGHRFRRDDYYRGFGYVLSYLQKIHQEEIKSNQIKRPGPFWEWDQYGIYILVLTPFALFFGGGIFYVIFGKGTSGPVWSSTARGSSSRNYGGGSSYGGGGSGGSGSGGNSGGSSYGGGDFGGGSSGGAGADGNY